jgi:hypothetical protein
VRTAALINGHLARRVSRAQGEVRKIAQAATIEMRAEADGPN